MRTIIYVLGIIALLLTFESCTVEEIQNAALKTVTGNDIDPPIPAPKPM